MGQPAARVGDPTAHGGVITGPGCPTVLIGGVPAARLGDMHMCPMVTPGLPPLPHVGGPISVGSAGVLIGGMPAARMGDLCTCVGPPATIVAGCLTVLIGEAGGGGGGGGGGGAAGSGGGSGALAASNLGLAIATHGGQPPETQPGATHWIEFRFVDKAGLPVGGVHFEYTGSDGKKDKGILQSKGTIRRENVPAGQCTVKLYDVSNAKWSVEEARTDDTVKLTADVEGIDPGTPARITIYERDIRGSDDVVDVIESEVKGGKIETDWKYRYVEEDEPSEAENVEGYSKPEYYFVAEAKGCAARSPLLFFKDWIEIEIRDDEDRPLADEEYRIVLPSGEIRTGKLDKNACARLENLPPGKCRVEIRNHPGSLLLE